MADYYSILKKTIASLPENNGAARRSVYSRARNAIVNQLKAYEPPLAPSEITAEQLRLEEAIRKVEAEAARESLGLGAPVVKPEPPAPAPEPAPTVAAPVSETEPAAPEPAPAPVVEQPAAAAPAEATPSPLKDTLAEAETLGSAASQATQNARDAVEPRAEQPAVEAAPVRQEPAFGSPAKADDGLFEPEPQTATIAEDATGSGLQAENKPDQAAKKTGRGRRSKPSASDALREKSSGNKIPLIAAAAVLMVLLLGAGAYFLLPSGDQTADSGPSAPAEDTQTATALQPDTQPEPAAPATDTPAEDTSKNTDRLLNDGTGDVVAPDARTVTTTTITPQTEPVVPTQPSIVSSAGSETAPDGAPAVPEQPPVAVPEDNLAAISPEETAPSDTAVATDNSVQRSILYEEGEEAGGAGTAAQGAVVWSLEEETNLEGESQAVLTAAIEIPERDVKVDIRIKPNDDTSLPASHLVEIKYEFPESFAAGDVVNVPGLVMKPTEEARGDALIGASVKVSPGFFWIALSSLPNEQQRNLALLRERGWIDIPMLYENGKRGILTLEKGAAGEDAVEKAITAWQAG
ncbi:hypothetical protein [Roseibium sediminicola]|uniref:CheA signal transduction histidine kinase n=1 Tax=Roseibium sediminicola TaxID=2933272 RepID=A0ABT0GUU0_9HYPH|nr:hypothetical protein [Roseibium sp. CAU 1639]MCK7613193.1 hypothetical protein [Roseibium sp. CAU 1639]